MVPSHNKNDFLLDLLNLQQDGKYAISAPTNWIEYNPILMVPTEIDEVIENLQDSILIGNDDNKEARWHFFIGSPGNGKSAAIGNLCKKIREIKGCELRDENNIDITTLETNKISYEINVFEKNKLFPSVKIVQDASVVREPFSHNVDPAKDLLKTLMIAWEKGISLIICTNRGVLEKLHRDNLKEKEIYHQPWFHIITQLVNATSSFGEIGTGYVFDESKSRKTAFKQVRIEYNHLDNRSLLRETNTFNSLVLKATSHEFWNSCVSCGITKKCPFYTNRDWLVNDEARANFLKLLNRAEILSGQVIVFREALAILSLILAGCPKDYKNQHPCDWVKNKINTDDFFSLASRRIYMCLFSSYSPHGLDPVESLRKKQLDALRDLSNGFRGCSSSTSNAIKNVIEKKSPSTDVGVIRLLGYDETIANLDPWGDDIPVSFYDKWDTEYDDIPLDFYPFITEIEQSCLDVWKELEANLELTIDHSVSDAYWALRRWSSNYLLHLGALYEGLTAWSQELDHFSWLLSLMDKLPAERSIDDKKEIVKIQDRIEKLLNSLTSSRDIIAVKLSDNVTLSGSWVNGQLKPIVSSTEASGSVSLTISFKGGRRAGEKAVLAAQMYLWLIRHEGGNMYDRCFPQELLTGICDARVRASSKGEYAFVDNDVELLINTSDSGIFRLTRYDGEVDVMYE